MAVEMNHSEFQIRQLVDEVIPPEMGKQSTILLDDAKSKVVLFAFASGVGLAEHVAQFPAFIQIIKGEATLTVADERIDGKPGTWIHMAAKTRHSVVAKTPMVMLLTLLK
jgi:quercetin dioxygenase-like cupin family protein